MVISSVRKDVHAIDVAHVTRIAVGSSANERCTCSGGAIFVVGSTTDLLEEYGILRRFVSFFLAQSTHISRVLACQLSAPPSTPLINPSSNRGGGAISVMNRQKSAI